MANAIVGSLKMLIEFQNILYTLLYLRLEEKMGAINFLQIKELEVVSKPNGASVWH